MREKSQVYVVMYCRKRGRRLPRDLKHKRLAALVAGETRIVPIVIRDPRETWCKDRAYISVVVSIVCTDYEHSEEEKKREEEEEEGGDEEKAEKELVERKKE